MSKEADKRTPAQIEREEFGAGWDDAGEHFGKAEDDDYEPGSLEEDERDEGAEGEPPAEEEGEGSEQDKDKDASAEGGGEGEQNDTDPDGATRASEDGTSGVESSDAGDGSKPASGEDSEEVVALKLQLARVLKQHNDAQSEIGRLKGWQRDAEEKATKAQSEAAAEETRKRKAELESALDAAMQEWGDKSDELGADKLKPILKGLIDSLVAPGAAPVESGTTFTEEQVREMVDARVKEQADVAANVAYANEHLGGDWWHATAIKDAPEAKQFEAWLVKQPQFIQNAADSKDVRDYVYVMQRYQELSGQGAKEDAKETKGDGAEDEVAKAREVRKAGAKSAKASTGDVRGGTREARSDDGDFGAGWDDAGRAFESEYDNGNYAWSGKDAKRITR